MLSLDRSSRLVAAAVKPASRTLLAAAAITAVAAGAPVAAQAAGVPCESHHLTSLGDDWPVGTNGALDGSVVPPPAIGGKLFASGHGLLTVNGEYPSTPEADGCTADGQSLNFPTRVLGGGLQVTRTVTVMDGAVRHLDTITNPTDQFKPASASFRLAVEKKQEPADSTTGDKTVNSFDSWMTAQSTGKGFSALRWHSAGGIAPTIDPFEDSVETTWEPFLGEMLPAKARYSLNLKPFETVRLMHWTAVAPDKDTARAAGLDALTPFRDLSSSVAASIVNWSPDPDGDGIVSAVDACPAVAAAGQANGCPAAAEAPQPPAPQPPAPQPAPPAAPSAGADQRGTAPAARDARAPRVTVSGLSARASRSLLRSTGLRPRVACDEACALTVKVTARKRVGKRVKTVALRSVKAPGRSAASRTVTLKLSGAKLRGVRGGKLRVELAATDGAGNTTRSARTVTVRG